MLLIAALDLFLGKEGFDKLFNFRPQKNLGSFQLFKQVKDLIWIGDIGHFCGLVVRLEGPRMSSGSLEEVEDKGARSRLTRIGAVQA